MNKIKIILVLALASLGLASQSWAQPEYSNVGRAGLTFLKIGIGSRAIGMGGAFTAVSNDASALYWNPAGVAKLKKMEGIFSHTNWVLDINQEYIGYVVPAGLMGNFGFSASFMSMGDFERTTIDDITTTIREDDGEGLSSFSANDLALGVTYARNMTDKFSVGVTAKYVREKIAEVSAGGMALDVGTFYLTGYKTLRIGMAILNYGPDIKFAGKDLQAEWTDTSWPSNYTGNSWEILSTAFPMPLQFKIGVAYDFLFGQQHTVITAADLIHPNDGNEKVAVGTEYTWKNSIANLSLRAGYLYDPDWYETKSAADNMSAGVGIGRKLGTSKINVDYAFTNKGYLENIHRFSLGLGF
ncbi:MAG: PorV/PorQ family protein [Candidatus Edwardsbacteria bacterium]|nr:PorV/PorQ family protein [Candidatus Edwardsbacteria bacterium]MBU1577295.1 PorV/PorQ family protein [Candidatus Edwardsbacteria bacterium]MBU2464268.1 PorV/PorQ family protein [Candidatus Edwardsbacteria bacterium]MBU2594896.1 PorV/PorQ family protein [Candidatus Edwardsbacteria bacterium]